MLKNYNLVISGSTTILWSKQRLEYHCNSCQMKQAWDYRLRHFLINSLSISHLPFVPYLSSVRRSVNPQLANYPLRARKLFFQQLIRVVARGLKKYHCLFTFVGVFTWLLAGKFKTVTRAQVHNVTWGTEKIIIAKGYKMQ